LSFAGNIKLGLCSYIIFSSIAAYPFVDFSQLGLLMNAQEWGNLIAAGVALATLWLGFETMRMSKAARASIDLATKPYLSLRGFFINIGMLHQTSIPNQHAFRIGLRLFSPSKVQIHYEVQSMLVTLNGLAATNPHFDTTKFVLHPDEEMLFFYPLIISGVPITTPAIADVEFRLNFWAVPEEMKSLDGKIRVDITSNATHEWHYLEGPNYS
jgi:hypothetical protein